MRSAGLVPYIGKIKHLDTALLRRVRRHALHLDVLGGIVASFGNFRGVMDAREYIASCSAKASIVQAMNRRCRGGEVPRKWESVPQTQSSSLTDMAEDPSESNESECTWCRPAQVNRIR